MFFLRKKHDLCSAQKKISHGHQCGRRRKTSHPYSFSPRVMKNVCLCLKNVSKTHRILAQVPEGPGPLGDQYLSALPPCLSRPPRHISHNSIPPPTKPADKQPFPPPLASPPGLGRGGGGARGGRDLEVEAWPLALHSSWFCLDWPAHLALRLLYGATSESSENKRANIARE